MSELPTRTVFSMPRGLFRARISSAFSALCACSCMLM